MSSARDVTVLALGTRVDVDDAIEGAVVVEVRVSGGPSSPRVLYMVEWWDEKCVNSGLFESWRVELAKKQEQQSFLVLCYDQAP